MASVPKQTRHVDYVLLNRVRKQCCAACRFLPPSDPAHVRSRGAGGPDTDWNLIPLCRKHHREQHTIGWSHMAYKYRAVAKWLLEHGWHPLGNKIWNPMLGESEEGT